MEEVWNKSDCAKEAKAIAAVCYLIILLRFLL